MLAVLNISEFLRAHALIVVVGYPSVVIGLMVMWGQLEERRWKRTHPQIQAAPSDSDWQWPVYTDRQDSTND